MTKISKSINTVKAVSNVAEYLRRVKPNYSSAELTAGALLILGYEYTSRDVTESTDDTIVRSLAAVSARARCFEKP